MLKPASHADSALPDCVVHLHDTRIRRREWGELLTEGLAGFTLLSAARVAYANHTLDALAGLDLVAGAALAVAVIRGALHLRQHRDVTSTGVNIVGVFGAVALLVEGVHKLHAADFTPGHKHFALGATTVLAGLLTGTVALLAARLEHRRALTITSRSVRMRLNIFRRFDAPWSQIVELQLDGGEARLIRTDGNASVVPLGRLLNRDEVTRALVDAARSRGIDVQPEGHYEAIGGKARSHPGGLQR